MTNYKEHPHDFRIEKAFERVFKAPKKVVYFELRYNRGALFSFDKNKNTFDIMSMGLKPTFKFNTKDGDVK